MNRLRVGVVIPVFNRPGLILEALDSIARQTVFPEIVVVVDDGSTDNTVARIDAWMAGHSDAEFGVKIILQRHQGQSVARNAGALELGEVDLIAFLDSDDIWPDDYIGRSVSALQNDPSAVAVSCNMLSTDFGGSRSKLHRFNEIVEDTTWHLFQGLLPGPQATVVRASAFHDIGGFEPSLPCGEDYYLFLKLSLRGQWLFTDGEPVLRRSSKSAENDHASRDGALARVVQAHMLEHFATQIVAYDAFAGRNWQQRVAKMWYRAGRYLIEQDRRPEAMQAFLLARRLRPGHLRAWFSTWRYHRYGRTSHSPSDCFPKLPFMGDRNGDVYRVATFLRQLTNKDDVILSQFAPEILDLFSVRTVISVEAFDRDDFSQKDRSKNYYLVAPQDAQPNFLENQSTERPLLAVISGADVQSPLEISRLGPDSLMSI